MPASGFIKWVADNEATLGKAAAAIATAGWLVWSRLGRLRSGKAIEAAYQAEAAKDATPEPSLDQTGSALRLTAQESMFLTANWELQKELLELKLRMREFMEDQAATSAELVHLRGETARYRAERDRARALAAQHQALADTLRDELEEDRRRAGSGHVTRSAQRTPVVPAPLPPPNPKAKR